MDTTYARLSFHGMGVIAAASIAVMVGCAKPGPEWKSFSSADAGFAIEFPGTFEPPMDAGKASSSRTYQLIPKDLPYSYIVLASEETIAPADLVAKRAAEEVRPLRSGSPYDKLEFKQLERHGALGLERLSYKDATGREKKFQRTLFLWGPRGTYSATVESKTAADPYAPEVQRFLDSFRLQGP